MKDRLTQLDSDEQGRWSAWALEWLGNENERFNEFLRYLSTYVVVGNAAGFLALVGLIENSVMANELKVSVCSFSVGMLFGIVSGLILMISQWRCLNEYRQRIVELYRGNLTFDEFNRAPNYYAKSIACFLICSIFAFAVGGVSFIWWIISLPSAG